jgi:hypothetical protein
MKKIKNVIIGLVIVVAFAFVSCSSASPYWVTNNAIGTKVGKSSGTCYFRVLCFNQDWSIQAAAKNGGITKIATVDIKKSNVLGIIWTFETTVTGE